MGERRGHAVCIAYQFQGHINPMFKLAKVLHSKGIYITFVNSESNHEKFLQSGGPTAMDGLPDFRFETLPEGPTSSDLNLNAALDFPSLVQLTRKNRLASLIRLISKLNTIKNNQDSTSAAIDSSIIPPPVTCIIADGFVTYATDAAEELGIPIAFYWIFGACSFMGLYHYQSIMETRGHTDESLYPAFQVEDDTVIDWIPGMKGMRVKDLPSFGKPNEHPAHLAYKIKYTTEALHRCSKASVNILNTFDELEPDLVRAMSSLFPTLYTIAPVQFLFTEKEEEKYRSLGSCSLQREEPLCLKWLDSKQPKSVLYISFGSIAVLTPEQVLEFGWGIANSNFEFLWIINPDVAEKTMPSELMKLINQRGFIASWCPQEQVLNHPSIRGSLTHTGWNSVMESLCAGLPLLCYPFTGDHPTICRYICSELGTGIEIDKEVSREQVERLIRKLMSDNVIKERVSELKKLAEKATAPGGSSSLNLERLVNTFCLPRAV